MPRIRVLQAVAGPGFSWTPGETYDVSGEVASAWADGVRAELVRTEPAETPEGNQEARSGQVETATAESAEGESVSPRRRGGTRRANQAREGEQE